MPEPVIVTFVPAEIWPFMVVTVPALPVVFWLSVGISAATMARNDGVPLEPFGEA